MTNTETKSKIIFVLPILIVLFLIILSQSALFILHPDKLSAGITLDFLVTIPLIYFLIIKDREVPKYTAISVLVIGIIIASTLIPKENQGLLIPIKTFLIPILEIAIFGYILFQVRAISKKLKENKNDKVDFFDQLLSSCKSLFPDRIASVLATEMAVGYYLFFGKPKETDENHFSYSKKNGIVSVIGILLVLVLVETFVVHILIENWSNKVAWFLTFLGLYSCLQIIAILRSLSKRLVKIDLDKNVLHLRYGFTNQVTIPFTNIKDIELNRKTLPKDKSIISLSQFSMLDSHNIILHLKEEQILNKIYGLKKSFKSIAFYLDEREDFVNKIKTEIR